MQYEAVFGFAAKEIQAYILSGDKLRDMVGGSEIVNRICGDFLDSALAAIVPGGACEVLSRGAGGARIGFASVHEARRFNAAWPLLIDGFAPGLKMVHGVEMVFAEGNGAALTALEQTFRRQRQLQTAVLPEIGPLIDRSPRTGQAAVRIGKDGLVDRSAARKQVEARDTASALVRRISDVSHGPWTDWPLDITELAGKDESYLGVIHADGNNLGLIGQRVLAAAAAIGKDQAVAFREFSAAVEAGTCAAAGVATNSVLLPDFQGRLKNNPRAKHAARPIVIGGDDLTIIVRADLALDFLDAYLTAFELEVNQNVERAFSAIGLSDTPPVVTACGGIAFVKSSFPFSRSYELAESICGFAKKSAKAVAGSGKVPTCLGFHRVTTSLVENYDGIRDGELLSNDRSVRLCGGPYTVGPQVTGLVPLEVLRSAAKIVSQLPSGPVREIIGALKETPNTVDELLARMIEVQSKQDRSLVQQFESVMRSMVTPGERNLLIDQHGNAPLADVHVLLAISAA